MPTQPITEREFEEWKDIPGYEGFYQASTLGRIRGLDRMTFRDRQIKGRLMKPCLSTKGYLMVSLCDSIGKDKNWLVHRLVAITFHENPFNKKTVNHINGIKTDNRPKNIEWATYGENSKHAFDTGLLSNCKILEGLKGESSPLSKLTDLDCLMIKSLVELGFRREYIAKRFSIGADYVGRIHREVRKVS